MQGVGFRPWVWKLAKDAGIRGSVCNDAQGVLIEAWGEQSALDGFLEQLRQEAPPLSRIESIERFSLHPGKTPAGDFTITTSREGETRTSVASDAATCVDCLIEIFDPEGRRYGYPFTNCTHCGPRLSIVHKVPYDRANTSMAPFIMCELCQSEYSDPLDRRFHAQPNACPDCGPQVWLEDSRGERLDITVNEVIHAAAKLIQEGSIVAIKGIGGIHLACDAGNDTAVYKLRQRKQRYHKAFALMARDAAMVGRYARMDEVAAGALGDAAAPIVVLPKAGASLAADLAPGQNTLGFMLPYTPLHHLLMGFLQRPIVLTSGNLSDEPQSTDNKEARQRLNGIADFFLLHNREIVTRLDDSVLHIVDKQPRLLRRARGYVPMPITLPRGFDRRTRILAMGGELKSTFCLIRDGKAILSQHLGDLENADTYREYQRMLRHYQGLYDFTPDLIVVDKHPEYLSTKLGKQLSSELQVPLVEVQHHHAHIAACMVERGMAQDTDPVLGVALDGLGYGEDGTFWGGEFMLADYQGFQRLASFQPIPMPGGNKAMYEPWRNTFAYLTTALDWDQIQQQYAELELIHFLQQKPLNNLQIMLDKQINSPLASSAGRLFDAVAAAIGICREHASFEGQAAMELQAAAQPHIHEQENRVVYPFEMHGQQLSWAPLWLALLDDLYQGTPPDIIAARFHISVAAAVATIATSLCSQHGIHKVVLGGGVFQNSILLKYTNKYILKQQIEVIVSSNLPVNDGGLSLGQGAIGLSGLL